MVLSMKQDEVMKFGRDNQLAMVFMDRAVTDYIAGRCCLLNGLFAGFVLAAQGVEKILQAYLHLKQKPKRFRHGLVKYASEVQKLYEIELNPYEDLLARLERYYWAKYPDDPHGRPSGMCTGEIHEIDEVVIYLIEQFPIPDEVKYHSGLYARLFSYDLKVLSKRQLPESHWAIHENKVLAEKLNLLFERFSEVMHHLDG